MAGTGLWRAFNLQCCSDCSLRQRPLICCYTAAVVSAPNSPALPTPGNAGFLFGKCELMFRQANAARGISSVQFPILRLFPVLWQYNAIELAQFPFSILFNQMIRCSTAPGTEPFFAVSVPQDFGMLHAFLRDCSFANTVSASLSHPAIFSAAAASSTGSGERGTNWAGPRGAPSDLLWLLFRFGIFEDFRHAERLPRAPVRC